MAAAVSSERDVRAALALRTWAVVGCSPDPGRDSHRIAKLLKERGYRVIPVNPEADEVLGERSYPSLRDVPGEVDVVDVFRRSEHAGAHVDEAIEIGAQAVWMQLGVMDENAAQRARAAGLRVVMDRCPAIEIPKLGIAGPEGDWREQVLEADRPSADVPRMYSRLARIYEVWARLTEARARKRVLELADPSPGEAVLEVATGTGAQLVELARRSSGGRTAGVELAEGMLRETRRRLEQAGLSGEVELHAGSALELPFEDESFDLVVNGYMLDLLPKDDIPRALSEFRRVLRPGGRLVLSNMTRGERRRERIWDWLYERGINLTANCRGVLAAPVLRELGLADVRREYMAQMGFPTEIVTARKERR